MRPFIAAFLSLAALAAAPARAVDEPETIYGRYHRAVVANNLQEVLEHVTAQTRTEISSLPVAHREAAVKMLGTSMPRGFRLADKTVAPDNQSARLIVKGSGGSVVDAKAEALWGNVRLALERGEWRVAAVEWGSEPPPGMQPEVRIPAQVAPASAAARKGAEQKTGTPAAPAASKSAPPARGGGALVGSTNAPPERKLGMTKEPCVFKPVMTAEDLENCK